MKKFLLILICLFSINIYAQTPTVSAGNVSSVAGDSVVIPINVQNFSNVGAITIKIQYTPSVLSWGRALNWDTQLSGALANATNGVATIAWDAIAGMSLSNGKLVDLKFLFNGGSTVLDFIEAQCEIADVNGNIISTTYINGSVNELISTITVVSPNGSESWVSGNQYNITWTDNISENVKIELYKGGVFNSTIIASTPSNGTYSWTIPLNQANGSDYKVRITSVNTGSLLDESNSNFTISQPVITVTTPLTGASWIVGSNQTVTWSSSNVTGNVNIKLSTDGGSTYPVTLAANTANDGTESITVPNNISATCRVKVESVDNTNIFGVNPGNFAINLPTIINITVNPISVNFGNVPNGGIYVDTVTIINGPNSTAELSGNISVSGTRFPIFSGGGAYSLLPDEQRKVIIWFVPDQNGTYNENLSITHNSTQVTSPVLVPLSASVFTPVITVTTPLAGATWTVGSSQAVTWSSSNVTGNVNIMLSTDEGSTYPVTLAANTANDGTQNITVPNNVSTTCRVKVESVNNPSIFGVNSGNFTIADAPNITVTSPNGSESWVSGNQYNITWTDNISENVKIELYKGGVFNSTIIASTPSDGTYSWTIPLSQITGSDYRVRITSVNTGTLYDESNSNFTINQPVITVTAPTAGNTLFQDSTKSVEWSSSNVEGNISIKLSTDGGLTYSTTLAANISNDGVENVVVPRIVSDSCKVKVESVLNNDVFGVSDSLFSIIIATSIEDELLPGIPDKYKLYQNAPNPFNPSTIIYYSVPKAAQIRIALYNILGEELEILVNEYMLPGNYKYNYNAHNISSGVYLIRMESENFIEHRKMVYLK